MASGRIVRLNSLLKEVISEVIIRDVRNPHVSQFVTVTRVDVTKDLHHAKVYISVIGTDEEKKESLKALNIAAGFIAVNASKKVVLRYFPQLSFKLDDSVDKHMRIEELLSEISDKRAEQAAHQESSDEESADKEPLTDE